jgi:hypothetical protein
MYLGNSNIAKYGTLINGLESHESLKDNQYPQKVIEANNVLSNHQFEKYNTKQHNDKLSKETSKET